MRTADGAVSWMKKQDAENTTGWDNKCERACRTAYGLPAMYDSAEKHGKAIPSSFRHGHEKPSKGDLIIIFNGKYGHIAIFDGNGWGGYSNDYHRRGQISYVSDLRNLVSWCGGTSWFVADAWWSSSNFVRTHKKPTAPAPTQPTVRLSNLKYGMRNDDVKDLQRALNKHLGGTDLPITGYYGTQTDAKVRQCQKAHVPPADPVQRSYVGARQAAHLGLKVV